MTAQKTNPERPSDYHNPLRRMLYDSPLHTLAGKIIFTVIVLIVLYLSIQTWIVWLTPLQNGLIILQGVLGAFLGSLLGLAFLRYLDRREPESWWYFVGALLFAMLFTTAPAAYLIILPIIIYALLKSGNWERQVIRDELADEVGTVVTPEEYEGVQGEKRFRLRSVPGYSAKIGQQIRNAQNSLAFHKSYLKSRNRLVEGDPLADYYRAEVTRLRSGT